MSDKELPTNGKPEPSKQQSQQKKKKKNDPLRPQPAWLFPPDEHNPILNPRPKSEAKIEAETKERLEAIDYLRHHSVFAPMKAAPPGQLLQLVAAFLTSYGFDSTSRVFTTERNARKKIQDWNDEIGKKFEKGTPSLLQIYQGWEREWQLQQAKRKAESGDVDDTSSEEEEGESSEEEVEETPKKKGKKKNKGSDSDSSDSDSDSDISSDDDKKKPVKAAKKAVTSVNGVKRKTASSSDSSSESDSDADSDDSEVAAKKQKVTKSKSKDVKTGATAKQANGVNGFKTTVAIPAHEQAQKKAKVSPDSDSASESSSSSSSSSSSDDSSDSDEETSKPVKKDKKAKVNGKDLKGAEKASTDSSKTLIEEPISAPTPVKKAKKASSDSSEASSDSDADSDDSSDSSSSESEDDSKSKAKSKKSGKAKDEPAAKASDSSAPKRKRSKSPKASADASTVQAAKVQKKHNNVPFSRISKDQVVDPRLASNAYVPYDYAQRAHEDLIVTRGKGFTKEKNKKKRGSYRGGIIDIGGGKGIKFDD